MNYTRNLSTRLRNKGFELVRETNHDQALQKGKLTVNVLHLSRQVVLSVDTSRISNFTARELDALDKLLNQKSIKNK